MTCCYTTSFSVRQSLLCVMTFRTHAPNGAWKNKKTTSYLRIFVSNVCRIVLLGQCKLRSWIIERDPSVLSQKPEPLPVAYGLRLLTSSLRCMTPFGEQDNDFGLEFGPSRAHIFFLGTPMRPMGCAHGQQGLPRSCKWIRLPLES